MEEVIMIAIGLFVVCTIALPMIIAARRGLDWLPLYILGNIFVIAGLLAYPLYTKEGYFSAAGWVGMLLCSTFQKCSLKKPVKLPVV